MSPRCTRILAFLFVALCASPFTAPFSACDLGTLTGPDHGGRHRRDRHHSSADHATQRPLVKRLTDRRNDLAVSGASAPDARRLDAAPYELRAGSPRVPAHRAPPQVLRV